MKIKNFLFYFLIIYESMWLHAQQIGTGLGYHTIVVNNNGMAYIWGRNDYGQLGYNSNSNSNTPIFVYNGGALDGKTVTKVAAGLFHSIALTSDGGGYTWGRNNSAQLNNGDNVNSNSPVTVNLNEPLPVEIIYFSAALTKSATVVLIWQTASEVNNFGFEIQRKNVGEIKFASAQWETTGFIEAQGNRNSLREYSFTDNKTSSGISKYRLKQIDTNGSFS